MRLARRQNRPAVKSYVITEFFKKTAAGGAVAGGAVLGARGLMQGPQEAPEDAVPPLADFESDELFDPYFKASPYFAVGWRRGPGGVIEFEDDQKGWNHDANGNQVIWY